MEGSNRQVKRKTESEQERKHNLAIVCVFFHEAAAVEVAVAVGDDGWWSGLHAGCGWLEGPQGLAR